MKESDVVIPEEIIEVKLAMRVGKLEAERDRLKAEMAYDAEHIKSLRTELEAYKKDNAYLIEQLPAQKHQKYLEGLEAGKAERDRLREKLQSAKSLPLPAPKLDNRIHGYVCGFNDGWYAYQQALKGG